MAAKPTLPGSAQGTDDRHLPVSSAPGLVLSSWAVFSATYARLENNRLLRPSAAYVLLNALLSAAVAWASLAFRSGSPRATCIWLTRSAPFWDSLPPRRSSRWCWNLSSARQGKVETSAL
jgi:hypothetical protein